MLRLAFNLIFFSQVNKIYLSLTCLCIHAGASVCFWLSARIEFQFEFEFNRLSEV